MVSSSLVGFSETKQREVLSSWIEKLIVLFAFAFAFVLLF
jgi:hypothetical protein